MKHILFLLLIILFLGCSSTKKASELINSGNYDTAIDTSVKKLRKSKTKKSSKTHMVLLHKAFKKAVKKDNDRLSFLKLDNNPENYEEIYGLYKHLEARQNKIKPLLPLYHNGRKVAFVIENYQNQIVKAKRNLVNHLYTKSSNELRRQTISKQEIRKVYENLKYVDELSPNYNNVTSLLREAHDRGTDFIFVSIHNDTNQIIPRKLENELLQFDTYGLDNFWTVYHSQKDPRLDYDYRMELNFKNIHISPERVRERDFIKEKVIKEKTIVKDSLGRSIEHFKSRKVRCHFYEIHQEKNCEVIAEVNYFDTKTRKLMECFPLRSQFVFDHAYGTYEGDRRALDNLLIEMLRVREVPFPSNEQMVYDTGTDLKVKLKNIIKRARRL